MSLYWQEYTTNSGNFHRYSVGTYVVHSMKINLAENLNLFCQVVPPTEINLLENLKFYI